MSVSFSPLCMHTYRLGGSDRLGRLASPLLNPPFPSFFSSQARIAMAEVLELLEAGEAKAYYGLAINWKPLQALVQALLDRGVLQGREVGG